MDGALSISERITKNMPDAKSATVMQAGYDAFLQFGLKRTTMQDIADRAGMSRAALYLHYKNKDDIFCAMMEAYFEAAAAAAEEALDSHSDPARALTAAFEAQMGDAGSALMQSPHAEELLSYKHSVGAAVMEAGREKLVAVYARWLERGVVEGVIDPTAVAGSADRMARVMLAALDGMKIGGFDWDGYVEARNHMARIFARAIVPCKVHETA